jgi:hypothetical protein
MPTVALGGFQLPPGRHYPLPIHSITSTINPPDSGTTPGSNLSIVLNEHFEEDGAIVFREAMQARL